MGTLEPGPNIGGDRTQQLRCSTLLTGTDAEVLDVVPVRDVTLMLYPGVAGVVVVGVADF
jgi:hypothetical protein